MWEKVYHEVCWCHWSLGSQLIGITEVQIIQWYVEEGAHIEEWKPLCQYQSDKAVDDVSQTIGIGIEAEKANSCRLLRDTRALSRSFISRRTIQSLREGYVPNISSKGKQWSNPVLIPSQALCDIEVDDGKYPDDNPPHEPRAEPAAPSPSSEVAAATQAAESSLAAPPPSVPLEEAPKSKHASLAVPAVRGLLKSHGINILDVTGSGKDGRVMKDDVLKFVAARDAPASPVPVPTPVSTDTRQTESTVNLTPIQSQMFKTMTKSLNTPHFLFADELKINDITAIRKKLASAKHDPTKITFLPFVVKAVSQALSEFPLLNAKVDTSDPNKPKLIMRAKQNIGIAMDTPSGLIVPNIKDVASRSIFDIAAEITRLSALGKDGKLTPADLSGGTITVSNIGNIGGTYVAPVIVPTEVAILGVGRSRAVPVFDDAGQVTRGDMVNFSWSADHRVVDGATMARMGNRVRELIESPELMMLNLR